MMTHRCSCNRPSVSGFFIVSQADIVPRGTTNTEHVRCRYVACAYMASFECRILILFAVLRACFLLLMAALRQHLLRASCGAGGHSLWTRSRSIPCSTTAYICVKYISRLRSLVLLGMSSSVAELNSSLQLS